MSAANSRRVRGHGLSIDRNPSSGTDFVRATSHKGRREVRTEPGETMHPNDPSLRSFIEVDVTSDFSIQNLPYGVFSTKDGLAPRVGVAIGNYVLDLWELEKDGRLSVGELGVFATPMLNPFMALGPKVWSRTRARISELLRHDHPELRDNGELRGRALVPMADAKLHLPFAVAGYTDFYSSKEHATNVGVMFRGKDNALQPNWLHMPIGYNGRASTVVVSGTKVRRPRGQLKPPTVELPSFGPCKRLDFELEMGVVIGQPSPMGEMLSEQQAEDMIFGFVLLNDWSARDIQQWEYVPLGPFQAKAFATSISPWVVTREALEPFRLHGPAQERQPLGDQLERHRAARTARRRQAHVPRRRRFARHARPVPGRRLPRRLWRG